ncbi:MAG: hypothetical protein CMJ46_01115 [Planctomyces sp.]|nr:hypothetical protein [Planctomyces sp.]
MSEYQITPIDCDKPSIKNLLDAFREIYEVGKIGMWSFQIEGDTSGTIFEDPELPDLTMGVVEEFMNDESIIESCDPFGELSDYMDQYEAKLAEQSGGEDWKDDEADEEDGEENYEATEHDEREMTAKFAGEIAEALETLSVNFEEIESIGEGQITIEWKESGPFVAEGVITNLLAAGGLYVEFPGSVDDARRLSADFIDAPVEDRHLQAQVVICDEAWSPWFDGGVSNFSMILFDKIVKQFHVLALSEGDAEEETEEEEV